MIIGELTARVKILLEKGLSRYHISEDQQFPKKYPEVPTLPDDGGSQKERLRWATRGPHHP
jgi:hypothetical protein